MGFGVGALVGFALLNDRRALSPTVAAVAGWIGLAAVVGTGLLLSSDTTYPGYIVTVPVIGTALMILGGGTPSGAGPTSLLSIGPMTFLGDISYSLYLVHWPLLQLPLAAGGYSSPLPLWVYALIALACVPIAWLLYTFVEQPGRRNGWLVTARPRRTFALAGAAMVAVAAVVASAWAWTTPLKFSDEKTVTATQIAPGPAGTPFVPSNLAPPLPTAKYDFPDLYNIGCQNGPFSTDASGCLIGDNPTHRWSRCLATRMPCNGFRRWPSSPMKGRSDC